MRKKKAPWIVIILLVALGGGVIAMRQAQPVVGSVDELNELYQKKMEDQMKSGTPPPSPLQKSRKSPDATTIKNSVEQVSLKANRPLPTKSPIALIMNPTTIVTHESVNPSAAFGRFWDKNQGRQNK